MSYFFITQSDINNTSIEEYIVVSWKIKERKKLKSGIVTTSGRVMGLSVFRGLKCFPKESFYLDSLSPLAIVFRPKEFLWVNSFRVSESKSFFRLQTLGENALLLGFVTLIQVYLQTTKLVLKMNKKLRWDLWGPSILTRTIQCECS